MKCKWQDIESHCHSPQACGGFGYCRERNVQAGGMKNVTPKQQKEWRAIDNPK